MRQTIDRTGPYMQEVILNNEDLDFRSQEAYKTLRSNIEFLGDEIRSIVITSCLPGEGKSSVSFELAKSIAENGRRALLVDADLRRSTMRSRYKSGRVGLGLTHYLIGRCELEEAICKTNTENLDVIFAGPVPPNPSELLGNRRFESLMAKGREAYGSVIIDAPPLGSVIDAAVIAKNADGVIFLISAGQVSRHFARRIKDQIGKSNGRLLGAVLNKVDMSGKGYYGKYYGKQYGSYYGSEAGSALDMKLVATDRHEA